MDVPGEAQAGRVQRPLGPSSNPPATACMPSHLLWVPEAFQAQVPARGGSVQGQGGFGQPPGCRPWLAGVWCGNVKWCSYCGKSLVAPQKIKYRITLRPGNSTPGSILKRQQTGSTQTKTCTWIFMATLFTVAQRWKQSTCPSADEWKNQLGSIHPVGYY